MSKPPTKRSAAIQMLGEHPDWTALQIAEVLCCEGEYIRRVAKEEGIPLTPSPIYRRFHYGNSSYDRLRGAELAERLKAVPADTRDLTGRWLGDPLPGRSALDQKREA